QANPNLAHPAFVSHSFRTAAQHDEWFAAFFLAHVEIAPAHRFSDAGPECFGERFLRREARREMAGRKFHRLRISDFTSSENAPQKTVAKPLDRILNPVAIDQVDPDADDAHRR